MTKRIEEIELHSKEVQDILGRMPSWLIMNGLVMVILLLTGLIIGSWFFKYPDIIEATVVVVADSTKTNSFTGNLQLKKNLAGKVKIGQQVNLKFFNYPYMKFGVVKGIVSKISTIPAGDSYPMEVYIPGEMVSTFGKKFEFRQELRGTAEIVADDERLLTRILHPLITAMGKKKVQ